jgi:hypothetical protein
MQPLWPNFGLETFISADAEYDTADLQHNSFGIPSHFLSLGID